MKKLIVGAIFLLLLIVPHIGAVEYQSVSNEVEQQVTNMFEGVKKLLINGFLIPLLMVILGFIIIHLGFPVAGFLLAGLYGLPVGLTLVSFMPDSKGVRPVLEFILFSIINIITLIIGTVLIAAIATIGKGIADAIIEQLPQCKGVVQ